MRWSLKSRIGQGEGLCLVVASTKSQSQLISSLVVLCGHPALTQFLDRVLQHLEMLRIVCWPDAQRVRVVEVVLVLLLLLIVGPAIRPPRLKVR